MWSALRTPDEPAAVAVRPAAEDAPASVPVERAGGAEQGFAEVYRAHAPYVWRVLRRLGIAVADVDDACQEVFLIVHRKLDRFEHRSSLRTWLYGIAVKCASGHRRRARRAPDEFVTDLAPGEPAIDAGQPESVARRQARAVLDEILDGLDHDKRAVFVLYELEELSMAEVAVAVGCPLQTAYSRLHAARATVEAAVNRHQAREGTP